MKGRFRFGLVTGFAVGYVLGAKAGRERYEQIRRAWEQLRPAVEQIGETAQGTLHSVEEKIRSRGDGSSRADRAAEYANITGPGTNV